MFPNGFSAAHARLIEPQRGVAVLIKGFDWPALQIEGDDLLGTPVGPIGHQDHRRACQLRAFAAHDEPDFAEPREAHGQSKRPVCFVLDGHRLIGGARDAWDEVFQGYVGPCQGDGFPCGILQAKAVGLQVPVLFQQADPVSFPVAGHGHQLFGKIPTVKEEDAQRDFVLNRCVP